MGFSKMDVDYLFDGDARFSELFVDDAEAKKTKGKLDEIKAHRKESTEALKDAQSGDFYFVVVARDQAEKDEVLKRLGVPNYERFVSADAVLGVVPGEVGD
jgi:predicted ribosome quality control (RQC) complex YloA/Tae2 family protein